MAQDDPVAHFFGGRQEPAPSQRPTDDGDDLELVGSPEADADEGLEGEIAVDAYETDKAIVIVAPIAGVDPDELEISAGEHTLTIAGKREADHLKREENVLTQEIYWGAFSRTLELPANAQPEKAEAAFKHGVLTVTIPKAAAEKKKTIKVKTQE